MHTIRFFPIGNADTCIMEIADDQVLLFDFANLGDPDDRNDKRINLSAAISQRLKEMKRDGFDVVGFTHGDDDHVHGSSEFFYFEHADKYQSKDRIKIKELWVPASMIVDEDVHDDAKVLRAEARHRLKEGKGIRVFSRPEILQAWLEDNGLSMDSRRSLFTDAGQIVPGFDKQNNGVEFFVHSPFAKHVENGVEDRNTCSLILHVTFSVDGIDTRMFLIGDTEYDVMKEIVQITKAKKRIERLQYDIYDVPHHCSYRALSDEKGEAQTNPDEDISWLLDQGRERCIYVCCSAVIPDEDTTQPPHVQAARYYKSVVAAKKGQFKVTMEHPSSNNPEPIVISIGSDGYKLVKAVAAPFVIASQQTAPRAG